MLETFYDSVDLFSGKLTRYLDTLVRGLNIAIYGFGGCPTRRKLRLIKANSFLGETCYVGLLGSVQEAILVVMVLGLAQTEGSRDLVDQLTAFMLMARRYLVLNQWCLEALLLTTIRLILERSPFFLAGISR